MTKFHKDRTKIVDFLLMVNLGPVANFCQWSRWLQSACRWNCFQKVTPYSKEPHLPADCNAYIIKYSHLLTNLVIIIYYFECTGFSISFCPLFYKLERKVGKNIWIMEYPVFFFYFSMFLFLPFFKFFPELNIGLICSH